MSAHPQFRTGPDVVVALLVHPQDNGSEHERRTLLGFAAQLAALRGERAVGFHDPGAAYPGHVYFVPSDTLTGEQALRLGIRGSDDLFGGVVPHAFVATKAISHPLLHAHAHTVPGWRHEFAPQVADAVLAGFTVFDRGDARIAGERLLARGPVRLKPVRASGSRGQEVAHDAATLQRMLDAMDPRELAGHGLVLEEDLQELRTFSIGQVHVAGLTASYWGLQRSTRSNEGAQVFGGSDLVVARGGFDALHALQPPPEIGRALAQAQRYDAAVRACFPGFHASRCNYDILLGRDAAGATRSAVLEQSWRAGGATGPELAALHAFQSDPRRQQVRASCFEVFGDSPEPPAGATVYFRGLDPRIGPLTKYTLVDPE